MNKTILTLTRNVFFNRKFFDTICKKYDFRLAPKNYYITTESSTENLDVKIKNINSLKLKSSKKNKNGLKDSTNSTSINNTSINNTNSHNTNSHNTNSHSNYNRDDVYILNGKILYSQKNKIEKNEFKIRTGIKKIKNIDNESKLLNKKLSGNLKKNNFTKLSDKQIKSGGSIKIAPSKNDYYNVNKESVGRISDIIGTTNSNINSNTNINHDNINTTDKIKSNKNETTFVIPTINNLNSICNDKKVDVRFFNSTKKNNEKLNNPTMLNETNENFIKETDKTKDTNKLGVVNEKSDNKEGDTEKKQQKSNEKSNGERSEQSNGERSEQSNGEQSEKGNTNISNNKQNNSNISSEVNQILHNTRSNINNNTNNKKNDDNDGKEDDSCIKQDIYEMIEEIKKDNEKKEIEKFLNSFLFYKSKQSTSLLGNYVSFYFCNMLSEELKNLKYYYYDGVKICVDTFLNTLRELDEQQLSRIANIYLADYFLKIFRILKMYNINFHFDNIKIENVKLLNIYNILGLNRNAGKKTKTKEKIKKFLYQHIFVDNKDIIELKKNNSKMEFVSNIIKNGVVTRMHILITMSYNMNTYNTILSKYITKTKFKNVHMELILENQLENPLFSLNTSDAINLKCSGWYLVDVNQILNGNLPYE
ncbi:conserved protein, unknown function [Hepatocystis sp. ex Piliocolobus tephrosceles]|nr:conserved protein, unknown function [Hepatocystis sp. ex Piliocolobus tephrosceles]